ncbi:exocyst complex component 7 [Tribolium castaneum]|uniref:Exocyst complex component 7 n=1 Tax=Tribolium castaneum TaxID=7070 RepID=D6WW45_TRICA|nr:PREDICTED: exocyst complex component 7 [Tribolium castaneum]EFA08190.1 Exocyst complex component 7-like Protein [Tribolium castaneum]|eukprot:XP_008196718.1 PREDICTED: exocyst complex component 7 [Tribolium castaneum]
MNIIEERTYEITSKLEKEKSNLSLLTERLKKSSQITKGIDTILNSFEERLSRLEDTILPVYNDTENLQKSQVNIDQTLTYLDDVISYYNVSSDVESTIEKGPGESGIDLDDYIHSLNRLAKAQKYFEKHIPQSVELENVTTLFHKGSDKLNSEFKTILDKYNTPMLPVVLLDLINYENSDNREKLPPVQIPDHTKAYLIKIANWLLDNGRDEYLTVYGKVRGAVLQRSLTMLRNHQKSVSGGSVHGVASSPMLRPKFQNRHEASRKPSTRRLHHAFERKANRMLLKASQTLEHSTGFTLGTRRASSHLDPSYNGEEFDNEQELENYLVCVIALHKLMQIEQALIKGIIAPRHQPRVFELIVREAMDTIVQDGENIVSRAKKCISRHDFGTVLVVFPILKQLRSLKPEFERTVEECDLNVKSKFDAILGMLHSTGAKALEDFIESLRSDSVTQLPSDGTVHELTSNVIMFLEQLLDYTDTIGMVLAQDVSYSRQLDRLKAADTNKALLGLYIKKVLVQLNHTLISKSEQYSDPALKAIFRLNNNNYVLKSLQRSSLLELYLISEPKCEEYYYNSIQEHKKAYSQSWGKLLNYIWCDDSPVNLLHGDKLRDKDRAVIKEKFAGFNKEIEDIAKVQRGYSIPDVELRESIKRDNKELIIPKYNSFYNMYAGVQFTKNPEKYIKHKPDEVSAVIDRFFDVAA